jgi:crotonobetainyl-CoA:carnitine CoA-transferase CaiB-like acyl-CoA transferase
VTSSSLAACWSGNLPGKVGGGFAFLAPYGMFQARDREFYMGVGSDRMFAALCGAIGREDLVADPRFARNGERIAHRAELDAELEPVLLTRDGEEWVALCTELGIPASLVSTIAEVVEQEQAHAREMVVDTGIDGVRTAGVPVKLSRTPGSVRRPPPRLGDADA